MAMDQKHEVHAHSTTI